MKTYRTWEEIVLDGQLGSRTVYVTAPSIKEAYRIAREKLNWNSTHSLIMERENYLSPEMPSGVVVREKEVRLYSEAEL